LQSSEGIGIITTGYITLVVATVGTPGVSSHGGYPNSFLIAQTQESAVA